MARARQGMERGRNLAGGRGHGRRRWPGRRLCPVPSRRRRWSTPSRRPKTPPRSWKVALMKSDGSVGDDFQKISDLATRLGDKLPGTTADFQNMMTMLRRQGMSSATILGGLGEAVRRTWASSCKMPVTEAAEFAAKMQDATRTSEKDMMGLMDVIQRTFYIGVDLDNMLQGFTKLSPVLGILKKEGLEASKCSRRCSS